MTPGRATWRWLLAILAAVMVSGCATSSGTVQSPGDPWESFNRRVWQFNERADDAVLRPAAKAWVRTVPAPARKGLANVLGNIGDIWSSFNQFLQGKPRQGLSMAGRVLVNTSVGLAGLFDPATGMGLPRNSEDFGQTLGRWGVGSGPYLVLPLLGPSTARDGLALPVDRAGAPAGLVASDNAAYAITAVDAIETRAGLLGATDLLDEMALDKYSMVRQAHLARRLDAVQDGAAQTNSTTPD